MGYVNVTNISSPKTNQDLRMYGINLTDNYSDGQMESCKGISTDRYPYITTKWQKESVDGGLPDGVEPISVFAWEKLFVVASDCKCYYGGKYVGDVKNTTIPKQYAVLNSKLVIFPDKVYFNLYDTESVSHDLNTAPLLATVNAGTITYREAVTS